MEGEDTLGATSSKVIKEVLLGGVKDGERKGGGKEERNGELVCHVAYIFAIKLTRKLNARIGHVT